MKPVPSDRERAEACVGLTDPVLGVECLISAIRRETIEACADECEKEAAALLSSFADEGFAIQAVADCADRIRRSALTKRPTQESK